MDFLDPQKQRRDTIMLLVGYVFIGIAVLLATIVLLEGAYGFGLSKDGELVQHGLVFISSTPSGATVRLAGADSTNKAVTNTRLSLVSGNYKMTVTKDGYRTWQQSFNLIGGNVLRLDYPFLFPSQLSSTSLKTYDGTPALATQSPDRRWLLVEQPGSTRDFDLYDLKSTNPKPQGLSIPSSAVTTGTTETWSLVEWADDNQHVLLSHAVDGKTEFVLVDRLDSTKTVNLNQSLGITPTKISLLNKKYDQYYVYDQAAQTLQTARLGDTSLQPFLTSVLSYQPYGNNIMLYASSKSAIDGKVAIDLLQDGKTYLIREVPANTSYILNLTRYSGDWYLAAGAASENKAYLYKNPVTQLNSKLAALVPLYVFKVDSPNYVAFSASAQFIMVENGSHFSVYDAENERGYHYDTKWPVDSPQLHASWMDGNRIDYVSGGKLVVLDFDNTNRQTLVPADPGFTPFFTPDYKHLETIAPGSTAPQMNLNTTPLRLPADM